MNSRFVDETPIFNTRERGEKKDCGYAWIILAASLITLTISWGLVLCFGIYFVAILEHFQCNRREVATVGALTYGVLCFAGPLVTIAETRYGARTVVMLGGIISACGMVITYFAVDLWQVYLGYGFLNGLGCSFMYIPCFAILPRYFDRYQHFATSFATVGSAVGNLVFSNLLIHVIDAFTWRGSMLINAGLLLQCCVCGALMRSNGTADKVENTGNTQPYDKPEKHPMHDIGLFSKDKSGDQNDHRALNFIKQNFAPRALNTNLFKEMKYLMFLIECFCYGGSSYVVFALVNELVIEHGLTMEDSANLVSILAAFNIFGRVAASLITHFQCTDRPLFFALATAFFTLSIFTMTMCYDFSAFAVSFSVFGLTYGVKTSQIAAVLIDLFGTECMTVGLAYGFLCSGLGGFIVPPLAGWLADISTIESSFMLAASFSCVALGSCVTIVFLHRQQISKNTRLPDRQEEVQFKH